MAGKDKTLVEHVANALVRYIGEQNFQPGDRIGTEAELVERMGVGRSTIREAIRMLASRNILEVRQGSGTYLSEGRGLVPDPLGLDLIHDQFKLTWDLLEIRMLLEPQLAYAAARNAVPAQIAALEELCDRMEALSAEGEDRSQADIRFHMGVAEASGNLAAPNLIPIIEKAADLFVYFTGQERTPETMAPHRDIVEGIKRRDPDWARDMMSMHLAFNRQELRRAAMRQGKL